jgi:Holliday junction resolvase RusA-like endonuclease
LYKAAVQAAAKEAIHFEETPIDCPVVITGEFVMRRPKRIPKSKINVPHCAKPDLDNLIKSTQDAIVDSGILRDDCVIWSVNFTKRYANPEEAPHARVKIIVEDLNSIDTINEA